MKPRFIPVLEQAIETGVSIGYARAFKHDDNPSNEKIRETIAACVMMEIYEWFDMGDEIDETH